MRLIPSNDCFSPCFCFNNLYYWLPHLQTHISVVPVDKIFLDLLSSGELSFAFVYFLFPMINLAKPYNASIFLSSVHRCLHYLQENPFYRLLRLHPILVFLAQVSKAPPPLQEDASCEEP
eukprot:Gb_39580 [translate_table: standard]